MEECSDPKKQRGGGGEEEEEEDVGVGSITSVHQETPIRLWERLQTDLLLTIFRRLNAKELLKGASVCCCSWNSISKDPSLWRDLNLPDFSATRALQLIEFYSNWSEGSLTSITFHEDCSSRVDRFTSLEQLHFVSERCPKLKRFNSSILNSSILPDFKQLHFVSERCPKLKRFNSYCKHWDLGNREVINMAISNLKELEAIQVDESFIFAESTLRQISQSCPNFSKLIVLGEMASETALLITKWLPKLRALDLFWCEIYGEDLLMILKGCKQLQSLRVSEWENTCKDVEIMDIALNRLKEFSCELGGVEPKGGVPKGPPRIVKHYT